MHRLTRATLTEFARQLTTLATIETHEGDDDAAERLQHLARECEDVASTQRASPCATGSASVLGATGSASALPESSNGTGKASGTQTPTT